MFMKKIAQIMPSQFIEDPNFVNGWKKYLDQLILIDDPEKTDPEIPMILPANPIGFTNTWMKAKYPYFAVNRPYIGSWLEKKRFSLRVSVNSFAPTKLGNMPFSRWPTTRLTRQPWKVSKVSNILIAPSRKSQTIFTGEDVAVWSERLKVFFEGQGANVKIRPKIGKKGVQHWGDASRGVTGLFSKDGDLDWADLVVSYSSAITAEAFWYGKKAISLGVCPTWVACDNHLDNWQDPAEPKNRDIWHDHVSWSQFTLEEWYSGAAQDLTVQYQGWPTEVEHTNNDIKL
jgi:hypothetical protein